VTDLYDDLGPRLEHAEAMVQWQSRALWLMWEAAFGVALWHSGDSPVCRRCIDQQATRRSLLPISVNDQRPRTES